MHFTFHNNYNNHFHCSMMHYTCDTHQQSKESNIKYLVREVGKQNQNNSSATEREESLNGLGSVQNILIATHT